MTGAAKRVTVLAISGSLRAGSTNTTVLLAAAALAPEGVDVRLYEGIGTLPYFNPDLDVEPAHPAVADFRARLASADAVLVCSPEYAHGVPGSLKNALDWVVGSGEFIDKPTALINATPRATLAHASLYETLRVMTATMVDSATIGLAVRRGLDVPGILNDPEISGTLRAALAALVAVRPRDESQIEG